MDCKAGRMLRISKCCKKPMTKEFIRWPSISTYNDALHYKWEWICTKCGSNSDYALKFPCGHRKSDMYIYSDLINQCNLTRCSKCTTIVMIDNCFDIRAINKMRGKFISIDELIKNNGVGD